MQVVSWMERVWHPRPDRKNSRKNAPEGAYMKDKEGYEGN